MLNSWRADDLPLHTMRWLLRVALPSTSDKSGQPVEEGRSLLEVKVRSIPWGKMGFGIGPQRGRQVLARPQNSLSPRRGPNDSPGHLQTAYFKLIWSRHVRAAAGPLLKRMVCRWQEQSRSLGRCLEAGGASLVKSMWLWKIRHSEASKLGLEGGLRKAEGMVSDPQSPIIWRGRKEVNNICETLRQQYKNNMWLKARLKGSERNSHSRSVQKSSPWAGASGGLGVGDVLQASQQHRGWVEQDRKEKVSHGWWSTDQRNQRLLSTDSGGVQHELNLQESKGRQVWLRIRLLLAEPQLIQSSRAQFQSASAFPQGFYNFPSYWATPRTLLRF